MKLVARNGAVFVGIEREDRIRRVIEQLAQALLIGLARAQGTLRGLVDKKHIGASGHSLGGIIIRLYAATYPHEVVGLVLVDASHEGQNVQFQACGVSW